MPLNSSLTLERITALLEIWQAVGKQHDKAVHELIRIGMSPEAPIITAAIALFDRYTQTLAEFIGDEGGWLDWHATDNHWGVAGLSYTAEDSHAEPRLVDSIQVLIELIREPFWRVEVVRPDPPRPAAETSLDSDGGRSSCT